VAVYDRESTAVHALRPPGLTYASGVVALDGTPTKRMWELSLGTRLNHRPVLASDEQRAEYIEHALNLNLVRTTEYIKSYNSPDHVNTDQDAVLLEEIADEHDTHPGLITTRTAEGEYDDVDVLELVDETKHYGNILGSNEFGETRLGAVIGPNHYGDQYIQTWGAYAGETVEQEPSAKGQDHRAPVVTSRRERAGECRPVVDTLSTFEEDARCVLLAVRATATGVTPMGVTRHPRRQHRRRRDSRARGLQARYRRSVLRWTAYLTVSAEDV
jgi:hypothetical protein